MWVPALLTLLTQPNPNLLGDRRAKDWVGMRGKKPTVGAGEPLRAGLTRPTGNPAADASAPTNFADRANGGKRASRQLLGRHRASAEDAFDDRAL